MHTMFEKGKALKKVIRFGNLNPKLRARFWQQISDQDNILDQVI